MNWATRKIAKRLTPKIIISFVSSPNNDGKLLRIEYQTVVKNMEQVYKCPGITKHRGLTYVFLLPLLFFNIYCNLYGLTYIYKMIQDYDNDDVETEVILDDEKIVLICRGKDDLNNDHL